MAPKLATKKATLKDPTSGLYSTKEKSGELARNHKANATAGDSANTLSMSKEPSPSDLLFAIGNLNKNLEDKFASLSTQIQELQSNITETRKWLQTLESGVSSHDSCIDALESLCSALKSDNKYMKARLEDLESRSRRQNIRIVRIPEGAEKGRPTDFIAELIPAVLGKDYFKTELKVDRAHRSLAAKLADGAPPRPLIARLHHPQARDLILRLASKNHPVLYNNKKIFFFPDLTQETMRQRKQFDGIREKCKAAKIRYGFLHPARFRMTVDGSSRTFSDPADADRFLASLRESLHQD